MHDGPYASGLSVAVEGLRRAARDGGIVLLPCWAGLSGHAPAAQLVVAGALAVVLHWHMANMWALECASRVAATET
jgi:hypothetical protein